MKIRIIAFLLLIAAVVPFMAACKPSSNNTNSNITGGNDEILGGGADRPDGPFYDDENLGGEIQGGSQGDGNSNQDNRPDIPVENADILALSYSRLENADLSFSFDFEFESDTEDKDVISLASLKKQNDGEHDFYSVSPSDLTPPELVYNYFKNEEDYLDLLSKSARATADYMIENITVMDTVVTLYDTNYILSYDAENDILTVIVYTLENGAFKTASEISIYYDADGDETVEMTTYEISDWGTYETNYVFYTAGKKYTISRGSVNVDGKHDNYYTTSAIKQNGMWRAVSAHFYSNNVLFTKDGTYDYGNGLLYISFLVENEDNVYTFNDTLHPFRDGGDLGTGDIAQADDEIRILPHIVWLPGLSIDMINGGAILLDASMLTGWEEYRITIDADWELDNPYSEHYFNTEKDFIRFTSGDVISGDEGIMWSKDYGPGSSYGTDYGSYFIDKDGNHHKIDESFVVTRLGGGTALINKDRNELSYVQLSILGGTGKESYAAKFHMVSEFFKHYGLGFIEGISDDFFGDLSTLMIKREGYVNGIFEELYGVKYTFEGYKHAMFSIKASLDSFGTEINEKIAEYKANGTVNFDEQPRRPAEIGLIPFASGLTGKVTITKDGISFENVTFTANKSIILSKDSNYKVIAAFVSDTDIIYLDAFDTAAYNGEAMTFTGKAVPLPTTAKVGDYKLAYYFAKIDGESHIRLSEMVLTPSSEFTEIKNKVDVNGGYYEYIYSYDEGATMFESSFTDTEAPVITTLGLTLDNDTGYYTLVCSELTAKSLIDLVSATDSRDGELTIDLTNISVKDSDVKLYEDTALTVGTIYEITVSDAAENEASILIKAIEPPVIPGENDTPDTSES